MSGTSYNVIVISLYWWLFSEILSIVTAKINYLQILLNVKFIFMLLNFAKRSMPPREDIESISKVSQQPQQQQQQTTSSDGTSMNIDIVLNESRIALLEDASDLNSRVILVKVMDCYE